MISLSRSSNNTTEKTSHNDWNRWTLVIWLLCFLWSPTLWSQTTFILEALPDYTPSEDSVFIVGNFNNWRPGDEAYYLQRNEFGQFWITISNLPRPMEYKFTRGTWSTVEGSRFAQTIDNRLYNPPVGKDTILLRIESWEDMGSFIPVYKRVKIKVTDLPKSTPTDASIYIAGDFNDWHPGDRDYQLTQQPDGSYTTWIPIRRDTIQYKFNRGNWSSVEGANNGRARLNRYYYHADQSSDLVLAKIQTWEDLSGNPINTYTFLLLLAAFQGLLLIIAINTIQDNNESANRLLSLLILLISVALIGRVSTYGREIFQWQPRLLLLPDMIYFLYGPVFLWYIQGLLTMPTKSRLRRWIHFIPACLHFLAYLPFLWMDTETFTSRVVDLSLKRYFIGAAVLALIFNAFYWWKCYRLIVNYELNTNNNYSFAQNVQYLTTVIKLKLFCLLVWALTYLIGLMGWSLGEDWVWLTDRLTDTVWGLFAFTVFFLGYFAMKQPEIFKVAEQEVLDEAEPISSSPSGQNNREELLQLKTKLEQLMEAEKPYLNSRLALSDLAELLGTNSHTLSRLINEGFDKNFYDFVNGYRVEEFKKRIVLPEYKNQTFLALAFDVGFNSKTAFNRSFKKLTNSTPRKFLQEYERKTRGTD
ncbi:MAG: helix-turn-helix domain-containing protein [Bacteroidota bacterium]